LIIKLEKQALKYINSQDRPTRERFRVALTGLAKEPPEGDIVPLIGHPPFQRLRIGGIFE